MFGCCSVQLLTAASIEAPFCSVLTSAEHKCSALCRNNREAMDRIVEVLIEKETIRGEEFRAILSEFTDIPESDMATPTKEESNIPAQI